MDFEPTWEDLKRYDDENRALRTRVAELEALVSLLQSAKEQAEHEHNELVLSLPARLHEVAERQREACACTAQTEATGATKCEGGPEFIAAAVRATPLVTEGDE